MCLLLQVPATQAAPTQIQAIMNGGTVIGTQCVSGLVVQFEDQGVTEFTEFGPDVPLFVKESATTRLKRTPSPPWRNGDRVKFWNIADRFFKDSEDH
jgi:hypothetical protein